MNILSNTNIDTNAGIIIHADTDTAQLIDINTVDMPYWYW